LAVVADRPGRIAAEQREPVLAAQFVPHRLGKFLMTA
jgi:hypothetical protein